MIADSTIYGKEWFLLSEGIMHNAPTGQSPVSLGCLPYAVSNEPAKMLYSTSVVETAIVRSSDFVCRCPIYQGLHHFCSLGHSDGWCRLEGCREFSYCRL